MSGSGWDDLTEADLGWCDELDAALDVLSSDEEDAAAAAEGDAAAAPSCPPQPTLPPLLSEAAARTQRLENEDEDDDDDVGGDGGGEKARYAHHHHHHHLQPRHGHFTSREEADRDLAEAADRRHHERVALEQVLGLDFDGRDGNTWLITARAARGGGGSNSKYKRGGSTSTALLKFYVPA
eukprot:gene26665-11937_t